MHQHRGTAQPQWQAAAFVQTTVLRVSKTKVQANDTRKTQNSLQGENHGVPDNAHVNLSRTNASKFSTKGGWEYEYLHSLRRA